MTLIAGFMRGPSLGVAVVLAWPVRGFDVETVSRDGRGSLHRRRSRWLPNATHDRLADHVSSCSVPRPSLTGCRNDLPSDHSVCG